MTTATIEKVVQNEVTVKASVKVKNGNWTAGKRKEYCNNQALSRLGETGLNTHGTKMWIIGYTDSQDIEVQFSDGVTKQATYQQFLNGHIKTPNDASVFGHGRIGIGSHLISINGKQTEKYAIWSNILQRCYSAKFQDKNPTYKDASIVKEWLNFQTFCDWHDANYYHIEGQRMEIDKDILHTGNKVYGPETCVFCPQEINVLFTKSDAKRGLYPIGVYFNKLSGKFLARCQVGNKKKQHLGSFSTLEEAFTVYKTFKENRIKEMAGKYKGIIPDNLYEAMLKYEVVDDLETIK